MASLRDRFDPRTKIISEALSPTTKAEAPQQPDEILVTETVSEPVIDQKPNPYSEQISKLQSEIDTLRNKRFEREYPENYSQRIIDRDRRDFYRGINNRIEQLQANIGRLSVRAAAFERTRENPEDFAKEVTAIKKKQAKKEREAIEQQIERTGIVEKGTFENLQPDDRRRLRQAITSGVAVTSTAQARAKAAEQTARKERNVISSGVKSEALRQALAAETKRQAAIPTTRTYVIPSGTETTSGRILSKDFSVSQGFAQKLEGADSLIIYDVDGKRTINEPKKVYSGEIREAPERQNFLKNYYGLLQADVRAVTTEFKQASIIGKTKIIATAPFRTYPNISSIGSGNVELIDTSILDRGGGFSLEGLRAQSALFRSSIERNIGSIGTFKGRAITGVIIGTTLIAPQTSVATQSIRQGATAGIKPAIQDLGTAVFISSVADPRKQFGQTAGEITSYAAPVIATKAVQASYLLGSKIRLDAFNRKLSSQYKGYPLIKSTTRSISKDLRRFGGRNQLSTELTVKSVVADARMTVRQEVLSISKTETTGRRLLRYQTINNKELARSSDDILALTITQKTRTILPTGIESGETLSSSFGVQTRTTRASARFITVGDVQKNIPFGARDAASVITYSSSRIPSGVRSLTTERSLTRYFVESPSKSKDLIIINKARAAGTSRTIKLLGDAGTKQIGQQKLGIEFYEPIAVIETPKGIFGIRQSPSGREIITKLKSFATIQGIKVTPKKSVVGPSFGLGTVNVGTTAVTTSGGLILLQKTATKTKQSQEQITISKEKIKTEQQQLQRPRVRTLEEIYGRQKQPAIKQKVIAESLQEAINRRSASLRPSQGILFFGRTSGSTGLIAGYSTRSLSSSQYSSQSVVQGVRAASLSAQSLAAAQMTAQDQTSSIGTLKNITSRVNNIDFIKEEYVSRRAGGFITPPSIKIPDFRLERKRSPGFQAFAKIAGEFRPIGSPGTREAAIYRGASFVERTAAATFEVRPTKGFVQPEDDELVSKSRYNLLLSQFARTGRRRETPGVRPEQSRFVERSRYRISTPGELQEITFKGLRSRRRKTR